MTARRAIDAGPLPHMALPDHPIRATWGWQAFVRLPRPMLDWVATASAAWALALSDAVGRPMGEAERIIALGFIAALYGVRTFEKTKGVA